MTDILGYCPLHPEATSPCVCCTRRATPAFIMEPAGMGRWICREGHLEIGSPLLQPSNASCARCGSSLSHVISGVYNPRDRGER